jgi:hypothetical protein
MQTVKTTAYIRTCLIRIRSQYMKSWTEHKMTDTSNKQSPLPYRQKLILNYLSIYHFQVVFQSAAAYCSVDCYDTIPQNGRSRVLLPMKVSFFFNWHNASSRTYSGDRSGSNRNDYQGSFWGHRAAGAWGWESHHLWAFLENVGASTSRSPMVFTLPRLIRLTFTFFF